MTKLFSSDSGMSEIDVNGSRYRKGKDGTFDVPQHDANYLRRSGDFGTAGIAIRSTVGFRCACGHLSVFKDSCGKCGASEGLVEERE